MVAEWRGSRLIFPGQLQFDPPQGTAWLFQVMLPNPDYAPPAAAQFPAHAPVTGAVCIQFFQPEGPARGRKSGMLRAPVPETPIHKNRHPGCWKHKIRFPKQGPVAAPSGNMVQLEQLDQGQLGVLVALPPDTRHDFRSLRLGEYVSHSQALAGGLSDPATICAIWQASRGGTALPTWWYCWVCGPQNSQP